MKLLSLNVTSASFTALLETNSTEAISTYISHIKDISEREGWLAMQLATLPFAIEQWQFSLQLRSAISSRGSNDHPHKGWIEEFEQQMLISVARGGTRERA